MRVGSQHSPIYFELSKYSRCTENIESWVIPYLCIYSVFIIYSFIHYITLFVYQYRERSIPYGFQRTISIYFYSI